MAASPMGPPSPSGEPGTQLLVTRSQVIPEGQLGSALLQYFSLDERHPSPPTARTTIHAVRTTSRMVLRRRRYRREHHTPTPAYTLD